MEKRKKYIGKYHGIRCYSVGQMIGNNWYGSYYCAKEKNGRYYKVKDSVSNSVDELKKYVNEHINELKA